MNIPQIAKKYNISENFLNSKDDGYIVAAESLKDLRKEVEYKYKDDNSVLEKIDKLTEFMLDLKRSNY